MIFKNKEHELSYKEFKSRAGVRDGDRERESLFYLLSLLSDTRKNINDLYNFEENWIELEGITKVWQTGGTTKITKLAFNLYNGWCGKDGENYSPLHLFSVADDNREYLLESIRIRFC